MKPEQRSRRIPHLPVLAGLMILIPALVVAGCTGNAPAAAGPVPDGTRWVLSGYLANGKIIPPLSGTTITLTFGNDGNIAGSAGCNHYFAGYRVQGTVVTIGPAGSTEMYCTGPGIMEQESAYLSLISRAATVSAGRDTLTFADSAGKTILSFTREVPPVPAPLVGTNWTLDSVYTKDAVASVIGGTTVNAVFDAEGRVSGTAGCNRYSGSFAQEGTSLAISSLGSTKMNCHGSGVMQQEDAYLESLKKATGFSIAGDRLTLTGADSAALLAFTKGP